VANGVPRNDSESLTRCSKAPRFVGTVDVSTLPERATNPTWFRDSG